jgi:hypothetical protein
MPRFADETTQIQGLDEFRRALKQADAALPKELAKENQRLGRTYFVPEAKRRASTRSNPRVSTRTIASIGAAAVQSGVVVYGGGKRAPEFDGSEFGSNQRRNTGHPSGKGHTTQFPARSGSFGRGSAGYFFYPAVRATAGKTREAYDGVLDKMIAKIAD